MYKNTLFMVEYRFKLAGLIVLKFVHKKTRTLHSARVNQTKPMKNYRRIAGMSIFYGLNVVLTVSQTF